MSCWTSLLQLDQLSRAGQACYQRLFRIPRLSGLASLVKLLVLFSYFIMCSLLFLLPFVSTPITWLLLKALPRICCRTQTAVCWHRCWDPLPFAFLQLTSIHCMQEPKLNFLCCVLHSFFFFSPSQDLHHFQPVFGDGRWKLSSVLFFFFFCPSRICVCNRYWYILLFDVFCSKTTFVVTCCRRFWMFSRSFFKACFLLSVLIAFCLLLLWRDNSINCFVIKNVNEELKQL